MPDKRIGFTEVFFILQHKKNKFFIFVRKFLRYVFSAGIIRNRRKIEASINNAKRFLEIQKEFGSFDNYIWSFVDNKAVKNHWNDISEVPATSELSDKVSKDLKNRDFKFLGSTIVYAHLQATGLINDHLVGCFKY